MIPYLIVLFFSVGLAQLGRRYGSNGIRRCTILIVMIFLMLFAGLRDKTIGTDTESYVRWLDVFNSVGTALSFPIEPGYSLLVFISGSLSDSYALLLTITAFLILALYIATLIKLTYRYETGIFIFITLGFYTFSFNGARQGLAAAICFFALPWLLERKTLTYFVFVALATTFHKTALIAFPLYFAARTRVDWRHILYVAIGATLLASFLSLFTQLAATFIDEKYATYGKTGDSGGEVKVAFLLVQGLIFYIFSKQIKDSAVFYARLLNIYLIGLAIALASVFGNVNPSGVLRLTAYFSHTAILLWPMLFLSFKNKHSKTIMATAFMCVAITYFLMTTSSFSNLTPYKINSELFQWH